MSEPTACPGCGAGIDDDQPAWFIFECESSYSRYRQEMEDFSPRCVAAQLAALHSQLDQERKAKGELIAGISEAVSLIVGRSYGAHEAAAKCAYEEAGNLLFEILPPEKIAALHHDQVAKDRTP
jgi:hypothetical protein